MGSTVEIKSGPTDKIKAIDEFVTRQAGGEIQTRVTSNTPKLLYLFVEGECYLFTRQDAIGLANSLLSLSQHMKETE